MGTVPGQKAVNADKFIEESRTQARHDLESAKVLLESPDPHLENVAFLLEQSYEKILKAAYVSYKTHVAPEPWKVTYKAILAHDIYFMLDMLRNVYEYYAGWVAQNATKYKQITDKFNLSNDLKKTIDTPEETRRNIMAGIDKIGQNLKLLEKKERLVGFVSKLDSNSFKETSAKRNRVQDPTDLLDKYERMMSKADRLSARDFKIMKEYATFLDMLKTLAPYTLPHAVASRYPMDECKMENLEAYRSAPEKLKGFFDKLACKIQILLDSERGFTEQIMRTHSKNFSNPDKSA